MILLIDNYDSFSYNLYQLVGSIEPDIRVVRNDVMTPKQMLALSPSGIIISPGPGKPEDAGYCIEAIKQLGGTIPILGVCLGHQAICAAYGATVSYAKLLMHGKQSQTVLDTDCPLFAGCPQTVAVGRYHSLAALENTIPDFLSITARTQDGEVMAVKHLRYHVYGLQFHPESILTPQGPNMVQNFIQITKETKK